MYSFDPERHEEALARIRSFVADRGWEVFHSPENLAKSVSIEAGELLECFQWDGAHFKEEDVKDELADVLVYCIDMANAFGWDIDELILRKMVKNEQKYPVEKAKGNNKKYTEL